MTLPTRTEPYDPYQPRNEPLPSSSHSGPSGATVGNSRVAAIQAQINDTVGIMRDNITKVTERQERLDSLESRTEALAVSAQGFRRTANRVRKKMWWNDMKMRLIIGVSIAIVVSFIILSVVQAIRKR